MDRYGYANCCRVADCRHPFDTYDGQDVLIFEEFRVGLKHGDMLNSLDGYPPGVRSPALEKLSPNFFDKPAGMWDT